MQLIILRPVRHDCAHVCMMRFLLLLTCARLWYVRRNNAENMLDMLVSVCVRGKKLTAEQSHYSQV